jgi:hypothetical protein
MAHKNNTSTSTPPARTRRSITALGATVLVGVLSWSAGLAGATPDNSFPAPGGASGVHTEVCGHAVVDGVYPAPGGASGVSTVRCITNADRVQTPATRG